MCLLKQEKELIRQRCESDKRELVAAQDHARQQSIKIQSLQREKIELTSRMEQDTLSARLETTDSMIQLMKDKGELELQCRQLKTNLAGTDRSEIHVTAYPRSRVGIVGVLGGTPPQFMSTDAHLCVKIGFKFQFFGKMSNISTADPPPPVLLGQFQHCLEA